MPIPGGTAFIAPSAETVPKSALCGSISQFASLSACQIPFRLGFPSAVRGARYAGCCCAIAGTEQTAGATSAASIKTVALFRMAHDGRFRTMGSQLGHDRASFLNSTEYARLFIMAARYLGCAPRPASMEGPNNDKPGPAVMEFPSLSVT